MQILQFQEPLQHHHSQLQEPLQHHHSHFQELLNQQPPKPLPQPPALHHAKKLINDSNPWNETSTKNDKLELLKFKLCSNSWIKNNKLELLILNESNPWNENSTKNNKLESLPKSPSATSKLKVLPDA